MNKRLFIALLKYALGVGVLAIVIALNWSRTTSEGEEVGLKAALSRPFNYEPFCIGLGICLLAVILTFVRWYVLVRAQNLPFTLLDAFRLGLIGYFFSTFLPGSIGGDLVKAGYLIREQSRRTVAVSTVLLDRALGLAGLFWLVAISGVLVWIVGPAANLRASTIAFMNSVTVVGCAVVVGTLVFWLVLGLISAHTSERLAARLDGIPKVGHMLAEFWRAVRMYRNRGGSVAVAMLLALIGHVGFVLVYYCGACTLLRPEEAIPSLANHFLFVPIGETILAGFPTPNGIGGGEFAFGWLYSTFGVLSVLGVLAMLVTRMINWTLGSLGFLVYLQMRPALRAELPPVNVNSSSQSPEPAA